MKAFELHDELQSVVNILRQNLIKHGLAFGALFVGMKGGHMIVMDEAMPADIRLGLLEDLQRTVQFTINHYRGVQ